jgi:hypothetical protein
MVVWGRRPCSISLLAIGIYGWHCKKKPGSAALIDLMMAVEDSGFCGKLPPCRVLPACFWGQIVEMCVNLEGV